MNVVYSYVGTLPHYSVLTVSQMRTFFNGPIYFIVEQIDSPFIPFLKDLGVTIVDYNDVRHNDFLDIVCETPLRNSYINNLPGREWLFVRAFERFFILKNCMDLLHLEDVFFVELDNLVYQNPNDWLPIFSQKDLAYMYDNRTRCASGIAYIKNTDALQLLLDGFINYLEVHKTKNVCLNEMDALYWFHNKYSEKVYIMPTHWKEYSIPFLYTQNFGDFGDSIFDSAPYGIFLFGEDYCHTQGERIRGVKWKGSELDITKYVYTWKRDNEGRNIPYVVHENKEYKLNNLHIHCKELHEGMSINFSPV